MPRPVESFRIFDYKAGRGCHSQQGDDSTGTLRSIDSARAESPAEILTFLAVLPLLADFDRGTLLRGGFLDAAEGVAGELEKRLSFRGTERNRPAGVAAHADLRVKRQFAEKRHLHLFRRAATATRAEHIDPLVAMRAVEVAHVLDDTKDRHLHLVKHVNRLARVLERHVRRRGHHDGASEGSALNQ